MPELPEVENTVRLLRKEVLKRTFVDVWIEDDRKKELYNLKGKRIEDVVRYGKNIFFLLNDGNIFFVHLKMTGHFLLGSWKKVVNPESGREDWFSEDKIMQDRRNGFIRAIFYLDNGKQIALSDMRKFAKLVIISKREMDEIILDKLGPDPLLIKKEEFLSLLSKEKRKIKPLLMDQSFLAGIGNIYASEALFMAKIDPKKASNLIADEKKEKLYDFLQDILKKSIKLGGDSASDYRLLDGTKGGYQNHHFVYMRENESCFHCNGKIKRIMVGGRSTYYCPLCQK